MGDLGQHSYREITTQGEAWQAAVWAALARRDDLLRVLRANAEQPIIFIGCGSTYYLAQYLAPLFQGLTGLACRSAPSSQLWLQTESAVAQGERPLVVALSRSGETTETVRAVEALRRRGSDAVTISAYADTPLAAASTLTIDIAEAQEQSFAQTRSFAAMLVAGQVMAGLAAENGAFLAELERLPGLAPEVIARAQPLARDLGGNETYDRITFLGSGPLYGLASEATVKTKEMSLTMAEPYPFMEFRHGPMSLLEPEHLVVGLLSDAMRGYEVEVLRDVREADSDVVVVADGADGLDPAFDQMFLLGSGLSEPARGVLYLPFIQLLAYYRAVLKGLNPDRPRNVVMAITLDDEDK